MESGGGDCAGGRAARTGRGPGRDPETDRRPRRTHPDLPVSGSPVAGLGARRQHGGRRGARHPRGRRRRRRSGAPGGTGRLRLADRGRRERDGAGRPGPARPLLPGEHPQDPDPAHAAADAGPGRGGDGDRRGRAGRGQPRRDRRGRAVLGGTAVPGARAAVGERRGQRPGPHRGRRRGDRRGHERDRGGAGRLRHGRRVAVRARRRRPVVVPVRPGARVPGADRGARTPSRSCRPRRRRCRRCPAAPPATRSRTRTRCSAPTPARSAGRPASPTPPGTRSWAQPSGAVGCSSSAS